MTEKMQNKLIILMCFIILISVLHSEISRRRAKAVTYWAVYEDGRKEQVETLVSVPLYDVNDAIGIWPEYVIEKEIELASSGIKTTLRSEPFILSENPEVQKRNKFGDRMVFYVPENK